ncbi:MAG: CDP-diacylglycerol--glycerol-3-phosphate 3-phosphatidyltransferase [Candidatus Omnitrophica bacterium]|nr:CDP-diacylglycerol--glycerol-3-phosphate 3-phosphatidyltransferase [Candidatus Omnitrophota bacterium]
MNTPNKITLLRIILSFFCIGFILADDYASLITAFILFIVASLTDILDGFLARKKNLTSDLGKLLDPIADKILIIGVLCAFLQLGIIDAWIVSLIMLREFIITGLRLYGLNRGVVLEAKRFGKHKTLSQVTGIFIIFLTLILIHILPGNKFLLFLKDSFIPLMMWYIVVITLSSGVYYFWVNRRAIRTF